MVMQQTDKDDIHRRVVASRSSKNLFNFLNCVFVRLIVNWISKTVHDCDADFVILLSN